MISLSTLTYDLNGAVSFEAAPETVYPQLTRRITRKATLDGLSTINDMGFTHSDGTIIVATRDFSVSDQLEYLVKNYSLLHIVTRNGSFKGAIKSLNTSITPMTFTFLISEKTNK